MHHKLRRGIVKALACMFKNALQAVQIADHFQILDWMSLYKTPEAIYIADCLMPQQPLLAHSSKK